MLRRAEARGNGPGAESDFRQVAKVTGGHGMAVVGSAT